MCSSGQHHGFAVKFPGPVRRLNNFVRHIVITEHPYIGDSLYRECTTDTVFKISK